MFGALGSLLTGGVTGLISSIFKQWMSYKQLKLEAEIRADERKFELDKMAEDRQTRIAEAQANIQIMETETQGIIATETLKADAQTKSKSYTHDKATYSSAEMRKQSKSMLFIDFCRGIIRPGLTVYMALLTTVVTFTIFYFLWEMRGSIELALSVSGGGPHGLSVVTQLLGLAAMLLDLIIYLTAACVGWWFGDRNSIGEKLINRNKTGFGK